MIDAPSSNWEKWKGFFPHISLFMNIKIVKFSLNNHFIKFREKKINIEYT